MILSFIAASVFTYRLRSTYSSFPSSESLIGISPIPVFIESAPSFSDKSKDSSLPVNTLILLRK
ncbi:hypothetical protein M733_05580 [Neisseria gonorrhoeae ATL_2011_05-13]|nr:hypothetical protein M733_05580 [Neisseria gonorrhoeae ATL_2011_05-13]